MHPNIQTSSCNVSAVLLGAPPDAMCPLKTYTIIQYLSHVHFSEPKMFLVQMLSIIKLEIYISLSSIDIPGRCKQKCFRTSPTA